MSLSGRLVVSAAVEGLADEAVVRRVVAFAGAEVGTVYGKVGKGRLRQQIQGYNQAARISPWVVLVDLDREQDCAPPLRQAWLPQPAAMMCFRIAVREVEAWLLADRERIAAFLSVSPARVPRAPESLPDPKRFVVELARVSRRRDIREDMVPSPGGGRDVGPAYVSRIVEFTEKHWHPATAGRNSDSLRRCIGAIKALVKSAGATPRITDAGQSSP
jgi:hypothetical protein